MSANEEYYIESNGAQHGPVNMATARIAVNGMPNAMVWKEGWDQWRRASEVFSSPSQTQAAQQSRTSNLRVLAKALSTWGAWLQVIGFVIIIATVMFSLLIGQEIRSPAPAIITFVSGMGAAISALFSGLLFKAGGEALVAFAQMSEDVEAIRNR